MSADPVALAARLPTPERLALVALVALDNGHPKSPDQVRRHVAGEAGGGAGSAAANALWRLAGLGLAEPSYQPVGTWALTDLGRQVHEALA